MKTFIYIVIIFILGSLVYNLTKYHYSESLFSDWNRPFVIGIGAGICGLLLALIMLKYRQLKPNLENQSKKG